MSKSSKNEGFEVLRDTILIRRKVTNVMRVLFLQFQKRLENFERNLTELTNEEEILKIKEELRTERFNFWLIKEECKTTASKCSELMSSLRTANTIWPLYMAEFLERRVCMDRALGACNALQDELQYIAEEVYADKNKFTALMLDIESLFKKIKSVRQADNRFLKELKDNPQKA